MKITGDLRDGSEFKFFVKRSCMAASTFTAVTKNEVIVSRRFSDIEDLPPSTPVIAHWHGQYKTEAFLSTVKELKAKAKEQGL